jgi:DNA-binding ferritin-like protein
LSVEKLVNTAFASRDAAHCAHLKTESYAQHEALGEFYDAVPRLVDTYAEAYQGLFGELGKLNADCSDITEKLRKDLLWMTENRETVTRGLPVLQNLYDDITAQYLRTIFKLSRLG